MKDDVKVRVYDVLAKAFMQEGVRTCFALLGDANMNWAARLAEQGCHMIYVRHEHCALAAAMAYARKTGDLGVASVTCGPGVTQLITALREGSAPTSPASASASAAAANPSWVTRSTRRDSLGPRYVAGSKSRTSQPKRTGSGEGSKRVIVAAVDRPALIVAQKLARSFPAGVFTPIPVTATRLIGEP